MGSDLKPEQRHDVLLFIWKAFMEGSRDTYHRELGEKITSRQQMLCLSYRFVVIGIYY